MSEAYPTLQLWERGPKIVAVGGGTGLSTMLRGLKKYTQNLTAIVTVADNGGGSGARTCASPRRGTSATVWRLWPTPNPSWSGC